MASVYIETTIPSAYVTTRTDPASLFRREGLLTPQIVTPEMLWLEDDQ
jgi:hypothetical protein